MQINCIGIVGYGSFGRFVHQLVQQYAPYLEVLISDPSYAESTDIQEVCQADIVFLCVPIRVFAQVLEQVVPLLGLSSLLVEVCTVKVYPIKLLRTYADQITYLATHPMFGPYSYKKKGSLKDLRLVVAEHTLAQTQYERITQLGQLLQINIVEMTPDEHDRLLAESLFLTHYITQTVLEAGFARTDIDTVSFGNLMDVVESVKNNKELFKDVWTYNPYCKQMLATFDLAQEEVRRELEQGENEA